MTGTDTMSVWLEGLTLQVRDVEESLKFYQQIPGAALEHHRPGQFALLRIGQSCSASAPPGSISRSQPTISMPSTRR